MFYISFEDLDVLGLSLGGPGFRGPKFWALKFMGPSFWASGPGSRLCLPCLDSKAPSFSFSYFFNKKKNIYPKSYLKHKVERFKYH